VNVTEVAYLPGYRALELFRRRELSPVDLVEAQLGRIERFGPRINAFTEIYADEALSAARERESIFASRSRKSRPLEGLTVAVKDSHDIAGKRTTHGSLIYAGNVATSTHVVCQRLMDAGAIVIGKTTTPEFCSAGVTYSRLFGATGTPWNTTYTAGGSSGGSAAALAAGMATLATGSDIAGSIRVPAACCGVVGYKPPYGRVPGTPPFNLDPYCVIGPLARSVGDCALMMNLISGVHSSDIATLRDTIDFPIDYAPVDGWKIAISQTLGITTVSDYVLSALDQTANALRSFGVTVDFVELGWNDKLTKAAINYLDHLFGASLVEYLNDYRDQLCDYNVFYAEKAGYSTAKDYLASFEVAATAYNKIATLFEHYDALICPTVASHEVAAEAKPFEYIEINGERIDTDFGWVLSHPFNMLGRLPVMAIPNGIAQNGLPTSIQIVARSYDDTRVFQLARALERAHPWLDCEERRPRL